MNPYTIYYRSVEIALIQILLDSTKVESLSSDSPEGFFRAGELTQLTANGIPADAVVYALAA